MIDVASIETADLVDLIRPNPHQDLSDLSDNERRDVLCELFFERKAFDSVSNELLKDVLSSILPPMPSNKTQEVFQLGLARKLIDENEKNPGFGLWSNFSDNRLVELFAIVESSSVPEASFYTKSIFATICQRECAEKVPPSVIYSFIRRQLPPTDSDRFRSVAKVMILLILDPLPAI